MTEMDISMESEAPHRTLLNMLPPDLVQQVLELLPHQSLIRFAVTCSGALEIVSSDHFWACLLQKIWPDIMGSPCHRDALMDVANGSYRVAFQELMGLHDHRSPYVRTHRNSFRFAPQSGQKQNYCPCLPSCRGGLVDAVGNRSTKAKIVMSERAQFTTLSSWGRT